jgi:hypothetical protein
VVATQAANLRGRHVLLARPPLHCTQYCLRSACGGGACGRRPHLSVFVPAASHHTEAGHGVVILDCTSGHG